MVERVERNPFGFEKPTKVYRYCKYGEVVVNLYPGNKAVMQNTATGWFYTGNTNEVFGFARAESQRIRGISNLLENRGDISQEAMTEHRCSGCARIQALIDAGNDGIWTCQVCGREIEWGT